MSIGFIFWLVMILWFFSWLFYWQAGSAYPWAIHANALIFFVLLFLLGWRVFGFVIQGA
jgi:hypothetical protein